MHQLARAFAVCGLAVAITAGTSASKAQERLPWEKPKMAQAQAQDPYAPRSQADTRSKADSGGQPQGRYQPRAYDNRTSGGYRQPDPVRPAPPARQYREPARRYAAPAETYQPRAYAPPPRTDGRYQRRDNGPGYNGRGYGGDRDYRSPNDDDRAYSQSEIVSTGHRFFGKLSRGLAKAIEYAFRSQGRPSGYILGEDAGGAFIAGLRYGEGYLHTKFGDRRKVFWQGPTLGYDFGGEGSRTMILVYNLDHPSQLFKRFGGIQGTAYVVGGAGVQILKHNQVTLAPIRTGVGLRLGANVGYLKFTRRPTWNPF